MKKHRYYLHVPKTLTNRWRVIGVVIVIVGLAITSILWALMARTNDLMVTDRLQEKVSRVVGTLEKNLEVYSDVLYGGRGLFLQNANTTADEWEVFMASQNLFERYPAINNVAYLQVADRQDAAAIERAISEREGEVTRLFPAPLTDQIAILVYATRTTPHQIIGLNAYGHSDIAGALERATISGVPEATVPFDSRNPERAGSKDVIISMPIYDRVVTDETSDVVKKEALTGFVNMSIHPKALIEQAVNEQPNPQPMDMTVTASDGTTILNTQDQIETDFIEVRSDLQVSGQVWTFSFRASDTFGLTYREQWAPVFMLVSGFVIMVAFASTYLYAVGVRIRRRS